MSSQNLFYTLFLLCLLALFIAIRLWLSAEKDLNRYMRNYYQQPRVKPFPIRRSQFRKFFLGLLFHSPVYE